MSAREALALAEAYGVHVEVEGDSLLLKADHEPAEEVRDALKTNKRDIITFLSAETVWDAQDWQDYFDDRAAILEFDRDYERAAAEGTAHESCVTKWLNDHPVSSEPGACACCGKPDGHGSVIVPFGVEGWGHIWLHHVCWKAWQEQRRTGAIAALSEMGISPEGQTLRRAIIDA
jgi:hypothetical protein